MPCVTLSASVEPGRSVQHSRSSVRNSSEPHDRLDSPRSEFGELQFLKPCTHDLRYIDSFHASLFACRYKVDPFDTCVRENTLTCLCTSSRRCSTDRVTGKSNSFKFFCCSCHIGSRFEKLMDVSGKPFIAHGIASPQPQQTTRNDHVSIHAFDLRMDIRCKSPLLARPQSSH